MKLVSYFLVRKMMAYQLTKHVWLLLDWGWIRLWQSSLCLSLCEKEVYGHIFEPFITLDVLSLLNMMKAKLCSFAALEKNNSNPAQFWSEVGYTERWRAPPSEDEKFKQRRARLTRHLQQCGMCALNLVACSYIRCWSPLLRLYVPGWGWLSRVAALVVTLKQDHLLWSSL